MQGRSIYGGPFVVVAHVLHVHEGRGVGGVPAAERERRDQVWDGADDGRGEEIRGRRGVPAQGAAEDQAQGEMSSSHCVRSTTCEAASGSCAFSYADETPDLTVGMWGNVRYGQTMARPRFRDDD